MKQKNLELVQQWAGKPGKPFIRSLRFSPSVGNQALARRIASSSKPR